MKNTINTWRKVGLSLAAVAGLMVEAFGAAPLPAGYAFAEYVELRDGSIDTGITITETMELRFKFAQTAMTGYRGIIKDHKAEDTQSTRIICNNGSQTTFLVHFMNKSSGGGTTMAAVTGPGQIVEGYLKKKEAKLNNVTKTLSFGSGNANTNKLGLYGYSDCYGRIYYFQIWDNSGDEPVLRCDFVPCVNVNDPTDCGLWDGTTVRKDTATIVSGPVISQFTVLPIPDQTYDGRPITPDVTVRAEGAGWLLKKGVDYELSYSDNDRAGTGYAIVQGCKGTGFEGTVLRVPFTIRTPYHVTGMVLDEEGDGTSWDSPMSLGAAIADAPDSGIILMKAGEYVVPATIAIAKPLDIRGGFLGTDDTTLAENPVTVLDAALDTEVPVLCKVSATTQGAQNRFSHIVFRNATLRGIGKTGAADLLLEDCAILTNGTVGVDSQANSYGKALRVESASGANVMLRNCLVQGNRTTVSSCYSGGALYLVSGARVTLENCDFIGNGVQIRNPRGGNQTTLNLYWFSGSAILSSVPIEATGCRFLQNFAEQSSTDGGCVRLNSGAKGSVFRNCVWAGNSGVQGYGTDYEMPAGALLVSLGSRTDSITVENCTFAYNANDCGQKTSAGLTVRTGTANVKNCIFFGNQLGSAASYMSADILAAANGVCNLSYSLLSADDKTSYDCETGGEVNLVEGVVFGDPLFVTPLDEVVAFRSNGVYTPNAATIEFLNALDVHLRSPAGTTLNGGTVMVFGGDELSPGIDRGDPTAACEQEPPPNGGRLNMGAYGNTLEASRTPSGQVGIDGPVSVTFPFPESSPFVSFKIGGEGDFNAEFTLTLSTNGTDACYVSEVFRGYHRGGAFAMRLPVCLVPGNTLVVRVDMSGKGDPVVAMSEATEVGGVLPPWYGHGGDPATVIHVRPGAFGTNDGTSWMDAYTNLADAADAMAFWDGNIHPEIWIAGTCGVERVATFAPKMPMTIRGGFTGCEDTAAERPAEGVAALDANQMTDILVELSTLADAPVEIERVAFVRAAKNGLRCPSLLAPLTLVSCRLEENGQAVAGNVINGRGVLASGESTLIISNCLFRGNVSATSSVEGGYGAGLYADGLAALTVIDTDFTENGIRMTDPVGPTATGRDTSTRGAAVYLNNVRGGFVRCAFRANRCVYVNSEGGVVKLVGACGGSAFTNCVFAGNENACGWRFDYDSGYSNSRASTVVLELSQASSTVDFVNCSFVRNLTGGVKAVGGIACVKGRAFVRNCLFRDNLVNKSSTTAKDIYLTKDGQADVDWCAFERADGSCVYAEDASTLSFPPENIVTNDPRLVASCPLSYVTYGGGIVPYFSLTQEALDAALAIDVHVQTKSPAIDAGDPASDFRREPKPNGRRINLGAYGNTSEAALSSGGLILFLK